MRTKPPLFLTLCLLLFLSTSCKPKTTTPNEILQIQQAVAATIAAIPTVTPAPPATPYPTPTPMSLAGLFCEYQFCIGHPAGLAFYDHLAAGDQLNPSNYNNGFLAAYQIPNVLINLIWLQAPGTTDPQFLLETILEDTSDAKTGSLEVKLVRGMNLVYTPITTTISPILPFGGAGAWVCGDRVFAWKAYTPTADEAAPLFEEALARFSCGQN